MTILTRNNRIKCVSYRFNFLEENNEVRELSVGSGLAFSRNLGEEEFKSLGEFSILYKFLVQVFLGPFKYTQPTITEEVIVDKA